MLYGLRKSRSTVCTLTQPLRDILVHKYAQLAAYHRTPVTALVGHRTTVIAPVDHRTPVNAPGGHRTPVNAPVVSSRERKRGEILTVARLSSGTASTHCGMGTIPTG